MAWLRGGCWSERAGNAEAGVEANVEAVPDAEALTDMEADVGAEVDARTAPSSARRRAHRGRRLGSRASPGQRLHSDVDRAHRAKERTQEPQPHERRQVVKAAVAPSLRLDEVASVAAVDVAVVRHLLAEVAGEPHVVATWSDALENRHVERCSQQNVRDCLEPRGVGPAHGLELWVLALGERMCKGDDIASDPTLR